MFTFHSCTIDADFLRKSNFADLWLLIVSKQGDRAASIGTIPVLFVCLFVCLFLGYTGKAKYLLDRNCASCSRHKIVWKFACLGRKMTPFVQKHKKSSRKLPISVYENCVSRSKT